MSLDIGQFVFFGIPMSATGFRVLQDAASIPGEAPREFNRADWIANHEKELSTVGVGDMNFSSTPLALLQTAESSPWYLVVRSSLAVGQEYVTLDAVQMANLTPAYRSLIQSVPGFTSVSPEWRAVPYVSY